MTWVPEGYEDTNETTGANGEAWQRRTADYSSPSPENLPTGRPNDRSKGPVGTWGGKSKFFTGLLVGGLASSDLC